MLDYTEIESIENYLATSLDAMLALDAARRTAEQDCAPAQTWFDLARQYEAQGRPAQAASCRRRGEYYQTQEITACAWDDVQAKGFDGCNGCPGCETIQGKKWL